MLRMIALSLLIATPALADVPPPPLPGAAQVVVVTFEAPSRVVTCTGGRDLKVVEATPLHPRLAPAGPIADPIVVSTDRAPLRDSNTDGIETLSFSVDADGRPLDIRRALASRGDIDAGGTPRNVRVEAQGGDPALADVAASAIAGSRFQPGRPVEACYGTFAATPRDTPAPPRPDIASFERPGDKCDVTKEALNLPAFKNYPRPYAARKVAGWAYLRFDVAPWGQIGNVQVVASEPSAAFGDAARGMLWTAKPKPPPEGYRGCLVPVIYAIPDPEPIID